MNQKADARGYIGQTVAVTVDRPLGSAHPKYPDNIYPVNYGYIAGTVSGDGAPLDAYVLGVDEACDTFTGVVVAVIHRLRDDDDKLIVVPAGTNPSDDDITEATWFMEHFFESEVWR